MIEKFGINMSISNIEKNTNRDRVIHMVHDRMRQSLANKIVSLYATETEQDFYTEYRMEVIVATKQDYWKDVHEATMKMQSGQFAYFT